MAWVKKFWHSKITKLLHLVTHLARSLIEDNVKCIVCILIINIFHLFLWFRDQWILFEPLFCLWLSWLIILQGIYNALIQGNPLFDWATFWHTSFQPHLQALFFIRPLQGAPPSAPSHYGQMLGIYMYSKYSFHFQLEFVQRYQAHLWFTWHQEEHSF